MLQGEQMFGSARTFVRVYAARLKEAPHYSITYFSLFVKGFLKNFLKKIFYFFVKTP